MKIQKIALWSWLTKSEAKTEILCPSDLRVDNALFAEELARNVKANLVPAEVSLCQVTWDDSDRKQVRILARYTGKQASSDVVQFLVGVEHLGNFAYVEEKVYLRPPRLPAIPEKRSTRVPAFLEKPSQKLLSAVEQAEHKLGEDIAARDKAAVTPATQEDKVSGDQGEQPPTPGSEPVEQVSTGADAAKEQIYTATKWLARGLRRANDAWQSQRDWEKAKKKEDEEWDIWRKEKLEAAYLAGVDDVFGRFALAMSSCVKMSIKTLFEDRQAELRNRVDQQKTQKEIEEEIDRRRKEAFA